MHLAALFSKSPMAGGHSSSSATGCARTASIRLDLASRCMVTSPFAVAALGPAPQRVEDATRLPAAGERRRLAMRVVRKPNPIEGKSLQMQQFPKIRKNEIGRVEPSLHPCCVKVKAASAASPPRYRVSAQAQASSLHLADVRSGGTHSTGTRERASREKAVPWGPGVALARLTPATRMHG